MNESDNVRSSLMQKLRYYIHGRVCILEVYYNFSTNLGGSEIKMN